MNRLFYGDNLNVLRDSVTSETIDLIYLDPPFNSNATYNILFKPVSGEMNQAQIEAFGDSWHWTDSAEEAYWDTLHSSFTATARMLESMRGFLGENDMMAYLSMMAVRLIELHRCLKSSGTLYLHCDSTASHYLKILLDSIFGPTNFRNEIFWKRSNPKSNASVNFPACTDTILRYCKSNRAVFYPQFESHDQSYVDSAYKYHDENGVYRLLPLLNPNDDRPNLTYEFLGITRVWRWTRERMEESYRSGLVVQLKPGAVPQYKKYLQDSKGKTVTNLWDIPATAGREALGYPTQKPVALLERIIEASSNEGDVVLDPFCGCGTTVHAAQKLGRQWIGIDVTHLAISLIERRLREAFSGIQFETIGVPKDIGGARALSEKDKHEFQKWALTLIPDAQPWKGGRKGADTGIDGVVHLRTGRGQGQRAIIEVKGGGAVGVDAVHKLKSVVEREKALLGLLVTLQPASAQAHKEAVAAGFVEVDMGTGTIRFRRIQILTIEELMTGARPELPLVDSTGFRKAKREDSTRQEELDI